MITNKVFQNVPKCFKMFQNVSKRFKMFQNVSKCFKMFQNVSGRRLLTQLSVGSIEVVADTKTSAIVSGVTFNAPSEVYFAAR